MTDPTQHQLERLARAVWPAYGMWFVEQHGWDSWEVIGPVLVWLAKEIDEAPSNTGPEYSLVTRWSRRFRQALLAEDPKAASLRAAIEWQDTHPACDHEWVDADNQVVSGALVCSKCKTITAKADVPEWQERNEGETNG